jgi:hypothetical protein
MGIVRHFNKGQLWLIATAVFLAPLVWADNEARVHYMLNCQGCHLHNGAGSLDGEVPEMKDYVGNFLKVPEGREYLVQVPGSANAPLPDEELANLLNWILLTIGRESTPADFTPYTEDEVGTLRATSLTNVVELRSTLIERINKVLRSE